MISPSATGARILVSERCEERSIFMMETQNRGRWERVYVVPRARRDDARDTLSIVLASSCVVDDAGR